MENTLTPRSSLFMLKLINRELAKRKVPGVLERLDVTIPDLSDVPDKWAYVRILATETARSLSPETGMVEVVVIV